MPSRFRPSFQPFSPRHKATRTHTTQSLLIGSGRGYLAPPARVVASARRQSLLRLVVAHSAPKKMMRTLLVNRTETPNQSLDLTAAYRPSTFQMTKSLSL